MNESIFKTELEKLNINITENQLESFNKYKELLQEYNKKFNLTSITKDEEIYLKHFYDSLCLFKIEELFEKKTLLDLGTGAGFPGIPLAIINPELSITLVESNGKKCEFLKLIKQTIKLNNVTIINQRGEDYTKENREIFDFATSRAVSDLRILLELEIPALKTGGYFLPLKSNYEEELNNSSHLIEELSCSVKEIIPYSLPIENSKRTILILQKNAPTSLKYPRSYNQIKKEIQKNNHS